MATNNEQAVRFHSGSQSLAGMLYRPAAPPVAALLLCDPLFEERKSAHRPLVELARELAARQVAVLRFDYRGCGDSGGDLPEFAVTDWTADTLAAWDFLRGQIPDGPIGCLGLRCGGIFAIRAMQQRPASAFLVLWEPVSNGRDYLQQEFRKTLMKQMLTFGGSQASRDSLFRTLEAGGTVDFDGYAVTAQLYRQLQQATPETLCPPAGRPVLLVGVSPTGQSSPALNRMKTDLELVPCPVTAQTLQEQPFWNLIGLVECAPLIRLTTDWVLAQLPGVRDETSLTPARSPAGGTGQAAVDGGELPVEFVSGNGTVRAVLHRPATANGKRPALLLLHGWSGDRTGPHRMFVKLARSLAIQGCLALRLDFRGRGDSDGATPDATIASMVADAGQALAFLREQHACRDVVLLGICSGGKVAIATAAENPGIAGLVLWSAEAMGHLRHAATNRRKGRYVLAQYLRKLTRGETWKKIFTLSVNVRQVNKALFRPETRSEQEARQEDRWLAQFRAFPGRILFLYGTNDPDTRFAAENYRAFCAARHIDHEIHAVEGANHSFYSLAWEQQVLAASTAWLNRHFPPDPEGRQAP